MGHGLPGPQSRCPLSTRWEGLLLGAPRFPTELSASLKLRELSGLLDLLQKILGTWYLTIFTHSLCPRYCSKYFLCIKLFKSSKPLSLVLDIEAENWSNLVKVTQPVKSRISLWTRQGAFPRWDAPLLRVHRRYSLTERLLGPHLWRDGPAAAGWRRVDFCTGPAPGLLQVGLCTPVWTPCCSVQLLYLECSNCSSLQSCSLFWGLDSFLGVREDKLQASVLHGQPFPSRELCLQLNFWVRFWLLQRQSQAVRERKSRLSDLPKWLWSPSPPQVTHLETGACLGLVFTNQPLWQHFTWNLAHSRLSPTLFSFPAFSICSVAARNKEVPISSRALGLGWVCSVPQRRSRGRTKVRCVRG